LRFVSGKIYPVVLGFLLKSAQSMKAPSINLQGLYDPAGFNPQDCNKQYIQNCY